MNAAPGNGSVQTVRELCELIWSLEREFNLLDLDVSGVKVWQYTRMEIYYHLAELSGVFIEAHPVKRSVRNLLAKLPQLLKELLVDSPLWLAFRKVDEVVIEHPRSVLFEGERVDIYTHIYREALRRSGKTVVSLNRLDPGVAVKSPDRHRYSLACLPLALVAWRRAKPCGLTAEALACINQVSARLSSALGREVSLAPILGRSIGKFKLYAGFYRWLFKAIKPQQVTVVIGYACGDAIHAAKQLGIKTTEIQHGTFSAYHLGYSYPGREAEVDLFPASMLTWGSYWAQLAPMPIAHDQLAVIGFDCFKQKLAALPPVNKQRTELVVISQGALGDKIAACVHAYCAGLQGYKVFYKLHPSEYERWREYPYLEEMARSGAIEIVTDQYDLYGLLNKAGIQVGVFSTALYEGLALGCQTILLDLPGVEYMTGLVDAGMVSLASDKQSFALALAAQLAPVNGAAAIFGVDENSAS